MKLNLKKSVKTAKNAKATTAKPATAKPATPAPKGAVKAKPATTPAKTEKPILSQALALLSGARGFACRFVDVRTFKTSGKVEVSARQNENGLSIAENDRAWGTVANGILEGEKKARIQLGGYVNGRNTGAKIELLKTEDFAKKAKAGKVKWSNEDKPITCHYIGDVSKKGMLAIVCQFNGKSFAWQCEQDSNSHNAHERGQVLAK